MPIQKYISRLINLVFLIALLSSCAGTVTKPAKDKWSTELRQAGFSSFQPPREGGDLGNIVTFDEQGREILVATANSCFPSLKMPAPVPVKLFTIANNVEKNLGISGGISELFKDSVDIDFTASANSKYSVSMALGGTDQTRLETLHISEAISNMNRESSCYRAAVSKENVIIISTLSANEVDYSFIDTNNQTALLTAEILDQAKIKPDLRRKYEGKATLKIQSLVQIGYNAIKASELPGLAGDKIEIRELGLEKIDDYRAAAMESRR